MTGSGSFYDCYKSQVCLTVSKLINVSVYIYRYVFLSLSKTNPTKNVIFNPAVCTATHAKVLYVFALK